MLPNKYDKKIGHILRRHSHSENTTKPQVKARCVCCQKYVHISTTLPSDDNRTNRKASRKKLSVIRDAKNKMCRYVGMGKENCHFHHFVKGRFLSGEV